MLSALSLASRLALLLVGFAAAAIAVQLFFAELVVRQAAYEHAFAHLDATADGLTRALQQALQSDTSLATSPNLQKIVEQQRAADDSIVRIAVFDEAGRSVFDTDTFRIGETVPAAWRESMPPDSAGWVRQADKALIAGRQLASGADRRRIGLVIVQDTSAIETSLMLHRLGVIRTGIAMLVAALLLSIGIASLLVRPIRRWSADVAGSIDRVLTGDVEPRQHAVPGRGIAEHIAASAELLRRTEHELLAIGTTSDNAS